MPLPRVAGLDRLGLGRRGTAAMSGRGDAARGGARRHRARNPGRDEAVRGLLAALDDRPTAIAVAAERGFSGGTRWILPDTACRATRVIEGERVRFRGAALTRRAAGLEAVREGPVSEAAALGADAGREVHRLGGAAIGW